MQSRINNVCLILFLSGSCMLLLLVSMQLLALTSDNHQQPIHIVSSQQKVDMATNTMTLTGEVLIKRGSIYIRADKVIITYPDGDGKNGNRVVEGYGNPVTFYQLQYNGKPVRGHAKTVRYETIKDLVILTGNAYLEQLNSNVQGDRITYLVKKQQMEACSDQGNRVTTVLVPAQLQDKVALKSQYNQINH